MSNNSRALNYILGIVVVLLVGYILFFQPSDVAVELPAPGATDTTTETVPSAVTECQTLWTDSDGDGYGARETEDELCPGEELPLGLATQGGDCNDFNASKWRLLEAYDDRDQDGYSTDKLSEVCTNNQVPKFYLATMSDELDCNDKNKLVYPGSDWAETAGSPDYDCDGDRDLSIGTIFLTSKSYKGNLGGLIGADAKCAEAALSSDSLPLIGTWKAVLSTSTVNAIDRMPNTEFVDAFGTLIAANKTEFVRNFILARIQYDEMGEISSFDNVWTGTEGDGEASDLEPSMTTCEDWTTDIAARGIIGSSRTTSNSGWLHIDDSTCGENFALYCIRTE